MGSQGNRREEKIVAVQRNVPPCSVNNLPNERRTRLNMYQQETRRTEGRGATRREVE